MDLLAPHLHPVGPFDLKAIGIVLVVVMVVLGVRGLVNGRRIARWTAEDMKEFEESEK